MFIGDFPFELSSLRWGPGWHATAGGLGPLYQMATGPPRYTSKMAIHISGRINWKTGELYDQPSEIPYVWGRWRSQNSGIWILRVDLPCWTGLPSLVWSLPYHRRHGPTVHDIMNLSWFFPDGSHFLIRRPTHWCLYDHMNISIDWIWFWLD